MGLFEPASMLAGFCLGTCLLLLLVGRSLLALRRRSIELERARAAALLDHEDRFRSMADSAPMILWLWDPEGRCAFANRSWLRFTGRALETDTGDGWCDVIHPDDRASCREVIRAAVAARRGFDLECRVRRQDGEYRWIINIGAPRLGSDGSYAGHIGCALDITERRRAEDALLRSEARHRALVNALPDLMFRLSRDGTCLDCVPRPEEESLRVVVGRNLRETLSEQLAARYLAHAEEALRTGRAQLFECAVEETEGRREHEVRMTVSGGNEVLTVVRDITERKDLERHMIAAREAALRASRAKSEFLANMSHEIRTPMNGVLGFVELLRGTRLDPEQQEYVTTIHTSGVALLTVLNDVLDFSKIEAGRIDLMDRPFDPREVMDSVARLFAPQAERKGLRFLRRGPATGVLVRGDPDRLRQVLLNLVANAVKFTDHGEVALEAELRLAENGCADLRLEVRDTGIGIPGEKRDLLFQAFSQVDSSSTRRFGGTGLGLAISKRLIELMGGRIDCQSRPGTGSVFRVELRLPVETTGAAPARTETRPEPVALAADRSGPVS